MMRAEAPSRQERYAVNSIALMSSGDTSLVSSNEDPILTVRVDSEKWFQYFGRFCFAHIEESLFYTVFSYETIFESLRLKWHAERGITSSVDEMVLCSAYQSIIAMGPIAIPMILRQFEREGDHPDHWFWALTALTGADPVPPEAEGIMRLMARAWLAWGRTRYDW